MSLKKLNKKSVVLYWVTLCLVTLTPCRLLATEYALDLKVNSKKLSTYYYQPSVQDTERKLIEVNGINRTYFLYIPKSLRSDASILIALHGAGRTGASMIDMWKAIAEKYAFIIIAPDGIGKNWKFERDEHLLIDAIIKRENLSLQNSTKNLYLFGHSNGAKQAIYTAALHPEIYNKVAVHGGALPNIISKKRKTQLLKPLNVAMFLGDSDEIFSVASGRATDDVLTYHGASSRLYIIKDHNHWYYHDAHQINEYIWRYFKSIK